MLVGEKNGFQIYWFCNVQYYQVYLNDKLIIDKKYKFSDVKSYII